MSALPAAAKEREIEQEILRAVKGIRYGSVEIVIHDSQVVQIERKEKLRLDKPATAR
ncbi:MAG: YezD family protein [Candidatus Latescibacteria bacterium]|nr:YezD family protein [Candidatus Latescibacterota bacterium]